MLPRGTRVVVADKDYQDAYIAILEEDFLEHQAILPLVRIQSMLCYPRQTAIMHRCIPCEIPPFQEGQVVRYPYACPAEDLPRQEYQASVDACLARYLAETEDIRVQQLLINHATGIFTRKRSIQ